MPLAINLHAQHGMDIVTSENYQALNPSASCDTYGKFWKKKITEVLGKTGPQIIGKPKNQSIFVQVIASSHDLGPQMVVKSKGFHLISRKSRLVKYYYLARFYLFQMFFVWAWLGLTCRKAPSSFGRGFWDWRPFPWLAFIVASELRYAYQYTSNLVPLQEKGEYPLFPVQI